MKGGISIPVRRQKTQGVTQVPASNPRSSISRASSTLLPFLGCPGHKCTAHREGPGHPPQSPTVKDSVFSPDLRPSHSRTQPLCRPPAPHPHASLPGHCHLQIRHLEPNMLRPELHIFFPKPAFLSHLLRSRNYPVTTYRTSVTQDPNRDQPAFLLPLNLSPGSALGPWAARPLQ